MKITQIAGFLGCGKTTLLLKLARELAADGDGPQAVDAFCEVLTNLINEEERQQVVEFVVALALAQVSDHKVLPDTQGRIAGKNGRFSLLFDVVHKIKHFAGLGEGKAHGRFV